MATPDLGRLAAHVHSRRLHLNLSLKRAGDLAGLSKDTWARVEHGEAVRHMTYDKIETALGWTGGSCRKILDGGEAVPLDDSSAVEITHVPPETLEGEIRNAVQGAMIASTNTPTAAEIRAVNERVIDLLRNRGILPPKG